MRIQDLLETTLYRYQPSWKAEGLPDVIHMKGRDRRESSASPFDIYGLAAALEFAGIECPRRWRSTFVTTNPGESKYFDYVEDAKSGIREVVIPAGVKLGAVPNDFNFNKTYVPAVYKMGMSMDRVLKNLDHQTSTPELQEVIHAIYEWKDEWDELYFGDERNDELYGRFKQALLRFDEIIMHKVVDANLIDPLIIGEGSLKGAMIVEIERAIHEGRLMIFNSVDDIPDTERGLEIWFEGDYEAKVPQAE